MITPYPFQRDGARFLAGMKTALLADEMGLGKTGQAVLGCDEIGAVKINVFCPSVAKPQWAREFKAWQKIPRTGKIVAEGDAMPEDVDVAIVGYDYGSRGNSMVRSCDVLILDEGHYLTNPASARTQAIYGHKCAGGVDGAVGWAERTWVLSGTPMRGYPSTLYPMMRALFPESLRGKKGHILSARVFTDMFCEGYRLFGGFKITGPKNLHVLKARLAPYFLRRRIDDVGLDIPPISFTDLELSSAQIRPPETPAGLELASDDEVISFLRNAVDGPRWRQELGLLKAAAVGDLLAMELDLGILEKVVVFAWHREALAILERRLAGHGMVCIKGGVSPAAKDAAEREFQTNANCRVFIGQIEAAGVSLTLTAAHQTVMAEMDWEPILNAQAAMRTRRITQTKPTFVRCATTSDPMDRRVTAANRRKAAGVKGVFGAGVETQMARAA